MKSMMLELAMVGSVEMSNGTPHSTMGSSMAQRSFAVSIPLWLADMATFVDRQIQLKSSISHQIILEITAFSGVSILVISVESWPPLFFNYFSLFFSFLHFFQKTTLREAIKKKKCVNKEIVLKGGRGSIWKPNFFIVINKEILVRREGVRAKVS